MRLRIVAVGTKMPGWVTEAFNEYAKRMPPELQVELVELAPGKRARNRPAERAVQQEGEAMLRAVAPGEGVIALDERGKSWSTLQLAEKLRGWLAEGRHYNLLIGGPDGLAPACRQRAEQSWSLSPLTLPHPLVRVVLIEQLYRAWSITAGHPYHRS